MKFHYFIFPILLFLASGQLFAADQTIDFVVDQSIMIGCYDKNQKNYLQADKCQELYKPGMVVWSGSKSMGVFDLLTFKEKLSLGEPCSEVISFAAEQGTKTGERKIELKNLGGEHAQYAALIYDDLIKIYPALKKKKLHISAIVQADVDGDKKNEILFSANTYTNPEFKETAHFGSITFFPLHSRTADVTSNFFHFSAVGMRKIGSDGKVKTSLLIEDVIDGSRIAKPKDENEWVQMLVTVIKIRGLIDLDSDGRFELLVEESYYEGSGTALYRLDKALEQAIKISGNGCGA